jgi:hypothetical protein
MKFPFGKIGVAVLAALAQSSKVAPKNEEQSLSLPNNTSVVKPVSVPSMISRGNVGQRGNEVSNELTSPENNVNRRTDTCSAINGDGPLINDILNHNPAIKNANRTALFFGDWSPGPLQTLQDQLLNSFMPAWLNSPIQSVLQQYGVNAGTINPAPVEGGPVSSKIADSMIADTIEKRVANGTLPPNNQIAVFLPPGTSAVSGDNVETCPGTLGYHSYTANALIPYTLVPFPCDLTNKNPNDLNNSDISEAMGFYGVNWGHEDMEMRTNPLPNLHNAWVTDPPGSAHQEGADLCEMGCDDSTLLTPQGNFTVQGFYSNDDKSCQPPPNSCMSGNMIVDCPSSTTSSVSTSTSSSGSAGLPSPTPPHTSNATKTSPSTALGFAALAIAGAMAMVSSSDSTKDEKEASDFAKNADISDQSSLKPLKPAMQNAMDTNSISRSQSTGSLTKNINLSTIGRSRELGTKINVKTR